MRERGERVRRRKEGNGGMKGGYSQEAMIGVVGLLCIV